MQKYLAIFGAMALGAVIMFGFTHSEVQADSRPEPFVCSETASVMVLGNENPIPAFHCRAGKLTCGIHSDGAISCVQSGGLFN